MLYLLLASLVFADERTHQYTDNEEVILWFNKAVPFNNPQETYTYSRLPLCRGTRQKKSYLLGLGEAVEGYELQDSGMPIQFKENLRPQTYCTKKLSKEDMSVLAGAIQRDFWVQMYLDDLPIWVPLGTQDESTKRVSLYTHYSFHLTYNNSNIIEARVLPEKPFYPWSSSTLQMSYSVFWSPTDTQFADRFESYLDPGFFENNIHWFSLVNSFVMVLLLCGVVLAILLRTLRRDYAKYESQELEPMDFIDSVGWKQVKGDAFRPPPFLLIFSGLLSQGWQLNFLAVMGLAISILHPMYSERGAFASIAIICYSVLGFVSGLIGAYFYGRNNGTRYIGCMVFGCVHYPLIVCSVCLALNSIAIVYSSSAAIPFISMVEIATLMGVVYFPLYVIGSIAGKKIVEKYPNDYKLGVVSVPILKEKQWYNDPLFLVMTGGLLPFGSISVEVYFIFTSFWNYKFYYVYGFALMGYIVLLLCLVCVGIVVTYIVLNSEDYRWHWVSFLSSGSIGAYLYLYAFYYYFVKTKMSGYFQFCFYFGYTGLASLSVFLMAGAAGYTASYYFVRTIYRQIKVE